MYNLPSAARDMKRIRRTKQKHKNNNKPSKAFNKRRNSMPVQNPKRTSHSRRRREETLNVVRNKVIRVHLSPSNRIVRKVGLPKSSTQIRLRTARQRKRPLLASKDQGLIVINRLIAK